MRAPHALLHQLDASVAASDHRRPDVGVVADQHVAACAELVDEIGYMRGAWRGPRRDRAEVEHPRVSIELAELSGAPLPVRAPINVELVGHLPGAVDRGAG